MGIVSTADTWFEVMALKVAGRAACVACLMDDNWELDLTVKHRFASAGAWGNPVELSRLWLICHLKFQVMYLRLWQCKQFEFPGRQIWCKKKTLVYLQCRDETCYDYLWNMSSCHIMSTIMDTWPTDLVGIALTNIISFSSVYLSLLTSQTPHPRK